MSGNLEIFLFLFKWTRAAKKKIVKRKKILLFAFLTVLINLFFKNLKIILFHFQTIFLRRSLIEKKKVSFQISHISQTFLHDHGSKGRAVTPSISLRFLKPYYNPLVAYVVL